jgi:hypothetical protein
MAGGECTGGEYIALEDSVFDLSKGLVVEPSLGICGVKEANWRMNVISGTDPVEARSTLAGSGVRAGMSRDTARML